MISNNIRQLRKRKGLTQTQLADLVGVSLPTIHNWEHGVFEPRGKKLDALADALGVSISELSAKSHDKTRVPVLGVVPAGIPLEAITDILDFEDIPNDWQGEYFGLRVRGDSMHPKYIDGDTIIVKVQPTCDNGQDCVVRVNGFDATLKQVHFVGNKVELRSLNPKYKPMVFPQVDVLGIVVELRRKI